MKWQLALLPLCVGLAGCNGNRPAAPSDPFLGSSRVPPPGTAGTVNPYYNAPMAGPAVSLPADVNAGGANAPLYNPGSAAPGAVAPGSAAPGGAAPAYLPGSPAGAAPMTAPQGSPYSPPPQNFNYKQGSRGRSPFSLRQPIPSLTDNVASFRGPGYRPPPPAVTRIAPPATGAADPEQVAALDRIFSDPSAPGMSLTATTPGFQARSLAIAQQSSAAAAAETGIRETGRTEPPAPFVQHNSIRIVEPKDAASAASSSSVTFVNPADRPKAATRTGGTSVVEITDLPPPRRRVNIQNDHSSSSSEGRSSLQFAAPAAADGSRVVLASATEELSAEKLATSELADESAIPRHQQYAFDPRYRWLKGKLEFSALSGGWKLRYIPIDGHTDQYGGSVVLANADQLAGFKAGQMVAVQGSIGAVEADSGFAPSYTISRIKRLGE